MSHVPSQPLFRPQSAVEHLATAEALTLTTLRLWAAPHREPETGHAPWFRGLQAAGVNQCGIHAFDTLFWIVLAAGTRELDVRCPTCPSLGVDEAWLLQLVSHSQFGLFPHAMDILEGWMNRAAVRAGIVHLNLFARALNEVGLIIELPTGAARLLHERQQTTVPQSQCIH